MQKKIMCHPLILWGSMTLCFALFLWVFSPILLPFIAGMILAYCLDPLVDRLEKIGLSRVLATSALLIFCLLLSVFLSLFLAPLVQLQFSHFIDNFPSYLEKLTQFIEARVPSWIREHANSLTTGQPLPGLGEMATKGIGFFLSFLTSIWSGGVAFFNLLSLIFITPVVAFYLLKDWDHMVKTIDSCLPRGQVQTCRTLAREIDETLAGFVRGQSMVCLILALFYGFFLSILGLNFGLLIGLLTGFLSFIPFVGALIGGVMAIGVAVVQFWPDWFSIGAVIVIFIAGQAFEGNVLQPLLIGGRIGVHPVWLIFSLFAFGYLFGFLGLLLAVPLAGIVAVFVKAFMRSYFEGPIYRGEMKE